MRILVVGDAMIDRYWAGDITRVSPGAPVPIVGINEIQVSEGGAANVARSVAPMGAEVRTHYSESFREDPVVKLRIIARGQQVCRLDFDKPQRPIQPGAVGMAADGCDIVVLSDYAKGALAHIAAIIWRCKRDGRKVFVDPKGPPCSRYEGADVLKPNVPELKEMVGSWESEDELEHKVKALQRKVGIPSVLLTRGAEGMTLYDGAVTQIPCEARAVYDVTGAGDTVIAAFSVAVSRGLSYREAALVANRAAGIAVGRFGTAVVTAQEIFG